MSESKYGSMSEAELTELIRTKLSSNAVWVRRALVVLYDQQTAAEQADPRNVHESNGRGFSPTEQDFLSNLAKQVKNGITLTERQNVWAFKLLPKYSGQLAKLSIELRIAALPSKEDTVREIKAKTRKPRKSRKKSEPAPDQDLVVVDEQPGIPVIWMKDAHINTPDRTMWAVSGEVGIVIDHGADSPAPRKIRVQSPFGSSVFDYELKSMGESSDGSKIEQIVYEAMVEEVKWTLTIYVGDSEPVPEWVRVFDSMIFPSADSRPSNPFIG